MTGPETKGTLRRGWRYALLGIIADDEGNFDADMWNQLNEAVAEMVVEAQAEAWYTGARDAGFCCCDPSDNPYRPKAGRCRS